MAQLSGLRLDVTLGIRMLFKYPVLTLASVLALAIAVALAASWFEFTADMARPRLPFPDADRIVALRNLDVESGTAERRALHDFELWRNELASIRDLGAAYQLEYNLTTADGRFATLSGAQITPSVFQVTRAEPFLGRALVESDEEPGAAPVVVLGYDAWQRLFDGDRSAIGATVRLGSAHSTVVGVMPEGFGFPLNQEIWAPLRGGAGGYGPREGPPIMIIGRLAPGTGIEQAEAELATVGRRLATQLPETHGSLRPEIRRFARGGEEAAIAALLNIPFLLFLVVVSANLATLLFARTAARETEIAMRSALGASRLRIILQLIAEAAVLTSVAIVLGLAAARWGLGWGMDLFFEVQQMRPPFWFDSGLSGFTVLYAGILALLGAVIIGGIPGIRITRGQPWNRLSASAVRTRRFGRLATAVVVTQVALCVAFVPVAIMTGQDLLTEQQSSDFPAEAYLSGRLTRQLESSPTIRGAAAEHETSEEPVASSFQEVHRRLRSDPAVLAATRASRLPGFNHPVEAIEIEGDSAGIVQTRLVSVDPDFFEVMGAEVIAGRSFRSEDVTGEVGVAMVREGWSRERFGGQSPIGRRIRYPVGEDRAATRWYEIVGVVRGVERAIGPGSAVSVFTPLRPQEHSSVHFYLRVANEPDALGASVQDLVAAVDPRLGVTDLKSLDEVWRPVERSNIFFTAALGFIAAIILLFALIGIYALMSFTVAQRTREIGIRAALGAHPRGIIVALFSRALSQIGLGILFGAILVSLTVARSPEGLRIVAAVAAAMVAVGLLGCSKPALRALRIQPTEALRTE